MFVNRVLFLGSCLRIILTIILVSLGAQICIVSFILFRSTNLYLKMVDKHPND